MSIRKRSKPTASRRRQRWIPIAVVVLVVIAAVAGVAWYLTTADRSDDDEPVASGASSPAESPLDGEPGASAFEDALAATAEAGDATVEIKLKARMPESLDDGVPDRRVVGSGSMVADRSVASIDYEMSEVPNAAGFFGHVDGALEVVYSDDDMLITFPIMRNVLPAGGKWVSYDLEYLSTEFALDKGIGQLRELVLSDPRLGLALLAGTEGPLEPTGEAEADGGTVVKYETEADTAEAAEAAPELAAVLEEMRDNLRIDSVPMTVSLDEEQRISKLKYKLVFPAKKGPGKVRLNVTVALTGFGASDVPEAPKEGEVVVYEDYLPTFYPDETPDETP